MPYRNAITILLAPAAAGKTKVALEWMAKPRRGRAILLVPSGLHRDKLALQVYGVMRRGSVCQFVRLVSMILRAARIDIAPASPILRTQIIRNELRRLATEGQLSQLAPVAHKPGLAADILALIDQLQAAEVSPEMLATAGVGPYDADLATIYAAYRASLARAGVDDTAGRITRAIAAIRTNSALLRSLALLVVDGFDQFTQLQLSLLRALADRAERSLITLTGSPTERPAHRRFVGTLAALQAILPEAHISYLPRTIAPAPPLAYAEVNLFELTEEAPIEANGTLQVISAPDREREVRAALRHIRQLIDTHSVAPEQIAVIFRSAAPYAPLLREVATEYGLALALASGQPLAEAPSIVALLAMLTLPDTGYARRTLIESWRNLGPHSPALVGSELPGIASFSQAASLLDRAARAGGYSNDPDRLRTLLQSIAEAPSDVEHEQEAAARSLEPEPDGPTITPDQAADLLTLLNAFIAWITPPAQATAETYVMWLSNLLRWAPESRSRKSATEHQPPASNLQPPASYVHASCLPFLPAQVACLRRVLTEISEASHRLQELPQPFSAFLADLTSAINAASYGQQPPAPGYVAALDALAARSACFAHIVLIGLAEGEFPAQLPAPIFYTRRERAILSSHGIPLPADDPADERTLFYEAVTRAQQSLTLCYTRLDDSGNPLQASPYLYDLLARFVSTSIPRHTIQAGSVPSYAQAASAQERLIALMDAVHHAGVQVPAEDPPDPLLAHVIHACAVERERARPDSYGPYAGILDDPDVIATLNTQFGPAHSWSVSQINDYTICPFRFAAAHILHLRQPGEPEQGMAQVGQGRILHAILASAGQRWAIRKLPADTAHEDDYQADLSAAADQVLASAPQTYGFEPGPFWEWEQAELRSALARAIRRTLHDADGWEQFTPVSTEESFGMGRGRQPLKLDTPAGPAQIIGRIDRIDQATNQSLALIDYKSGSTPPSLRDTLSGRDVQLIVYTLAVEQLIAPGQTVDRASYLALRSGKRSKALTHTERNQAEAALRTSLASAITGARTGQFPVRPSDGCPPACAFASICRIEASGKTASRKPEAFEKL
ncbi:MAG: hypothetical protein HGA19_12410 [Oscillochloris sp.]|nr:hypothetical protein [Oscillochloris sp.]